MAQLDASNRIGELVDISSEGMRLRAYVPRDLPFTPPLLLDPNLQRRLQEAYLVLGRLDGAATVLPDRDLVYYMYLRKEAVLSSQIEGTQSSLEDFLRLEETGNARQWPDSQREILYYTQATQLALSVPFNAPVGVEHLEEWHASLLAAGRSEQAQRGRLRTQQNYIGGKGRLMFVPPPPEHVRPKIDNWLTYFNGAEVAGGPLVKSAVMHAQFETIHPFMDGNGRLGRMLITLLLCRSGVLRWPLLFLSLHFKKHRLDYYELLNNVREHGDWESWLDFFLAGIIDIAETSARSVIAVAGLIQTDRNRVQSQSGSVIRLYEQLVLSPITTPMSLSERTGLAIPTVRRALDALCGMEICAEVTGRRRDRLYRYNTYLDLLNAGTELD